MTMTADDIYKLIVELRHNRSEMADVEAKKAEANAPRQLYPTLSSLSSRNGGGVILFGLDESQGFKVVGVADVAKLQSDVASLAADTMEPPVRPVFSIAEIEGGIVLAAEVPECAISKKPCYYKEVGLSGGSYMRVGASDRRMSEYEIYGYVSSRGQPKDDCRPVAEAALPDLDDELLNAYIDSQDRIRPGLRLSGMDREGQLATLGIIAHSGGKSAPTLAGLLVFGRYPQQFFPSLVATFLRYAGVDEMTPGPGGERFLDNAKFEGPIPLIVRQALARAMANMRTGSLITGLYRQDIPEYPETALREALVNAVAHRDYCDLAKGSQVQIRMFADRLEIQSPGGLFGTVTEDNIDNEQSTRNPALMRLLEDMHLVENRGTGISAMIREMRQANLEPPGFTDKRSSFWVTFKNHTMMDSEAIAWLGGFSDADLNDRQRTALVLIRRHHRIVNQDYQRLSSVDGPTATRELRGLVEAKLIEQYSTRGGAYYMLVPELQEKEPTAPTSASETKIMEYVREHGSVTNRVVRQILKVSRPQAMRMLASMVESGSLRLEGRGRASTYVALR